MPDLKQLPHIAEAQRSPLVEQLLVQLEHLLEENRRQAEIIQQMRDEIAVLKGQKAKPKFKPSGMETETEPDGDCSERDDTDEWRRHRRDDARQKIDECESEDEQSTYLPGRTDDFGELCHEDQYRQGIDESIHYRA